jgi:hypothetical protein
MTEKGTQVGDSEQRGKTVLTDLEKELLKIRWLAVGTCPQCGKEVVRDCECDVAVCRCSSVVKVDLTPSLILPPKLSRYFDDLAEKIGCTSDDLLNACFEVGLENFDELYQKGLVKLAKERVT